jgi:tetratricopeptide (TPR) repeat protein
MWAEHEYVPPWHLVFGRLDWQQANDYCSTVKLGGYSGWRLPTLDEAKALGYYRFVETTTYYQSTGLTHDCSVEENPSRQCPDRPEAQTAPAHEAFSLKGRNQQYGTLMWTSTASPKVPDAVWIFSGSSPIETADLTLVNLKTNSLAHRYPMAALCVRTMEPDILQVAEAAQVEVPVPDVKTLNAYAMLNKARLAYDAGQYQESITQAQSSLLIQPALQTAYWGIGISYGMLGQWDLAIASLNTAFKFDKNQNGYVYAALQWAKASKKAAKKGEKPKIKGKEWKPPKWNGPPWS